MLTYCNKSHNFMNKQTNFIIFMYYSIFLSIIYIKFGVLIFLAAIKVSYKMTHIGAETQTHCCSHIMTVSERHFLRRIKTEILTSFLA